MTRSGPRRSRVTCHDVIMPASFGAASRARVAQLHLITSAPARLPCTTRLLWHFNGFSRRNTSNKFNCKFAWKHVRAHAARVAKFRIKPHHDEDTMRFSPPFLLPLSLAIYIFLRQFYKSDRSRWDDIDRRRLRNWRILSHTFECLISLCNIRECNILAITTRIGFDN